MSFIIDNYSFLRLAKAIKARQDILKLDGSIADADVEFKNIMMMPYTKENTIETLENSPNLLNLLIEFLTEDIYVREHPETDTLNRDNLWDSYEFLRRMTCFQDSTLIVEKSVGVIPKRKTNGFFPGY